MSAAVAIAGGVFCVLSPLLALCGLREAQFTIGLQCFVAASVCRLREAQFTMGLQCFEGRICVRVERSAVYDGASVFYSAAVCGLCCS